jgi:hypothetical protein
MIRFTCECDKLLRAREGQAGWTAACPACGRQQKATLKALLTRDGGEPVTPP